MPQSPSSVYGPLQNPPKGYPCLQTRKRAIGFSHDPPTPPQLPRPQFPRIHRLCTVRTALLECSVVSGSLLLRVAARVVARGRVFWAVFRADLSANLLGIPGVQGQVLKAVTDICPSCSSLLLLHLLILLLLLLLLLLLRISVPNDTCASSSSYTCTPRLQKSLWVHIWSEHSSSSR